MIVEIHDFNRVAVHPNVGEVVDAALRGRPVTTEVRWLDEKGEVQRSTEKVFPFSVTEIATKSKSKDKKIAHREDKLPRVYLFGINRAKMEQAAMEMPLKINIASELDNANILVTSKKYYHRKPQKIRDAELAGLPIYVLRSNAIGEIKEFLDSVCAGERKASAISLALKEAEEAITQVMNGKPSMQLSPQSAYIRRLQHLMAERSHLASRSLGKEPQRRVEILRNP